MRVFIVFFLFFLFYCRGRAVFYGSGNQSEFAATSNGIKAFGIEQTSAVFWIAAQFFGLVAQFFRLATIFGEALK
jgi:hypothetical protein